MSETCADDSSGEWLPDGTDTMCGGPVGGDAQVGESFSIRFRRADQPCAMITRTAYPASGTSSCQEGFFVRVQTEWLVCRDPADPGGTEIWSDCLDDDKPGFYRTVTEAERAARQVAIALLHDDRPLAWDGRAPWQPGDDCS